MSDVPPGEEQWQVIFRRLHALDDGGVRRCYLPEALEFAGYDFPNSIAIDELCDLITPYDVLNFKDFARFLDDYGAAQDQACAEAFTDLAALSGGTTLSTSELTSIIESGGVVIPKQAVSEIASEIADVSQISLKQFRRLLEVARARGGFCRRELARFHAAFQRFDRGRAGSMSTAELAAALGWLNFATSLEDVSAISQEVDTDDSGTICWQEFLLALRKLRWREALRLRGLLGELHDAEAFDRVLRAVGYVPMGAAVREAAEDAGIYVVDSSSISLDDLWRFLEVYRERDGFTREDLTEISAAFDRYDRKREGRISTLEVGKVLRWFGCPTAWELQQKLVAEMDIDGCGCLDLHEIRKLIRKLREADLVLMWQLFQDLNKDDSGRLHETQCHQALRTLRCPLPPLELDSPGQKAPDEASGTSGPASPAARHPLHRRGSEVSSAFQQRLRATPFVGAKIRTYTLLQFIELATRMRRQGEAQFRENAGYSQDQIESLRETFERYDADGSGDIASSELRRALMDVSPMLATSSSARPQLVQILAEVDGNGDSRLDFPEFLRFMRQIHDLNDQHFLDREYQVARRANFTPEEVEEFRGLFLGQDELKPRARMSLAELRMFAERIGPLTPQHIAELSASFQEIASEANGMRSADFPEFLQLMRQLLDMNFANVKASFVCKEGYISAGGDLLVATMTVEQAKIRCGTLPACCGFTFRGGPTRAAVEIHFKDKWDVHGSGWTSYRQDFGIENLEQPQVALLDEGPTRARNHRATVF